MFTTYTSILISLKQLTKPKRKKMTTFFPEFSVYPIPTFDLKQEKLRVFSLAHQTLSSMLGKVMPSVNNLALQTNILVDNPLDSQNVRITNLF